MTTTSTAMVDPTPGPLPATGAGSWPDLLSTAADDCLAVLREAADRDWSGPAGDLDWTCRQTLDHLALGLVGYAGLLIACPADRYITLFASLDPQAPIHACLEGIDIAASLLTATVRDATPETRAWHPWGHSDAAGFAAMGITELAVHTNDIAKAFGLPWAPPPVLSAAVLARLFPDAPSRHGASDTLLWCTGRISLPGLPRRADWQWDGTVR